MFGNNEIRNSSAIRDEFGISIAETYEFGVAKKNGLVDRRLGVTDNDVKCDTCFEGAV